MTADQTNDIERRFSFHPADEKRGKQHDAVRNAYRTLAHFVAGTTPVGRHQALALTALQESMMWANAAIAIDQADDASDATADADPSHRPTRHNGAGGSSWISCSCTWRSASHASHDEALQEHAEHVRAAAR